MSENNEFIVTRAGREVLRGDNAEILNAARQGRLLSNDLVYDSTTAQWSFARSLSILRGFPIRDRAPIESQTNPDGSVLETGRRLLAQRRRLGRILRAFGVIVALSSFTVLLFLIPDVQRSEKKEDIKKLLEFDERAMKIEGSGQGFTDRENQRKGNSNMDSKAVVVDGEYEQNLETDDEGRKAALLLTPEERAELAKVLKPEAATGAAASTDLSEDSPEATSEMDRSPSIQAPKLPDEMAEDGEEKQPPVLIRPRLEELKQKLEAMTKAADASTNEKDIADAIENALKEADELSREVDRASVGGETAEELNSLVESIRGKLEVGCDQLKRAQQCKMRIRYPQWSTAAISAIIRKDVILGMTAEQVDSSIGEPKQTRNEGNQTIWCYDVDCERRVEFTNSRVMVYKSGVVTSDETIETAPVQELLVEP